MRTREVKRQRVKLDRPRKTIAQLAKEQGVKPLCWEKLVGKGADLWDSDEELEQFLRDVRKRRQEGK